jgi:hypothetical protein
MNEDNTAETVKKRLKQELLKDSVHQNEQAHSGIGQIANDESLSFREKMKQIAQQARLAEATSNKEVRLTRKQPK